MCHCSYENKLHYYKCEGKLSQQKYWDRPRDLIESDNDCGLSLSLSDLVFLARPLYACLGWKKVKDVFLIEAIFSYRDNIINSSKYIIKIKNK